LRWEFAVRRLAKVSWILAAGSVVVNGAVAVALWPELRPAAKGFVLKLKAAPRDHELHLARIVELVEAEGLRSDRDRADFVRSWVHRNSVHRIDGEHAKYAFDTPRVVSMLWSTHAEGAPPAHLSCGPRALAMKRILTELGILSRMTMIFTDDFGELRSHTYLGVFDRDTRRWEIQDPDFDAYYVNARTGARASTLELVFGNLDDFVPHQPGRSGWDATDLGKVRQWFEAMLLAPDFEGGRAVVLVNRDRFDLAKRYPNEGNEDFAQFARRRLGRPVVVENQSLASSAQVANR
jgi:hypothetical protein